MKSILVVEDDMTLRTLITEGLKLAGYAVIEAGNGEEALAYLSNKAPPLLPNIILTDLSMPQMDGIELITALRKTFQQQIFIVAMTGGLPSHASTNKDFVLLRAADVFGADMTIEKPFRISDLVDGLHSLET